MKVCHPKKSFATLQMSDTNLIKMPSDLFSDSSADESSSNDEAPASKTRKLDMYLQSNTRCNQPNSSTSDSASSNVLVEF